ncbi:MAG TPA: SURF1 family protein [Longimicrobiaceae bacterium]|nr:SURF1 family protein [Longimicrobiaceae bacterium]
MKTTPRGVLAALLVLAVAATCVRLGFWQLDRLEQRRARNAAIRAAQALPLLEMDSAAAAAVASDPGAHLNRRVRVRGVYDPAREVVLRGRAREGRPGVHLVTPLRIAGGTAVVLVNRGWIPSPDATTVERGRFAAGGVREVVGILQEVPRTGNRGQPSARGGGDTTYRRLDLEVARARSPLPVLPLYVQQLPDSTAPAAGPPHPVPPPALDEGPHLGYAIQWFSFAAIAVIGFGVMVLRRR